MLPYLRRIDRAEWYANHGPLSRELQARLAAWWGLPGEAVALLSSATTGLTLALRAAGAVPGTRCLLPSWTFAASAGSAVAAGMRPSFIDVDPLTWVPDPAEVERLARADDVGAVMIVAPFGAPLDLAGWGALQQRLGKPVVIDAAAAFDTLRADGPMAAGCCPVVVSLHATKVFGLGEGGAVLCRDPVMMERIRRLAQFGFLGTRESVLPGSNGKLSEYGAAVGLASLDEWPDARLRWQVAATRYVRALPDGVQASPGFGQGWVTSTLNLVFPGDVPAAALEEAGIGTLRWWGPGCHAQPAFAGCAGEALPVTELLARRTVGVPFWRDLTLAQIERVCAAVAANLPAAATPVPARA